MSYAALAIILIKHSHYPMGFFIFSLSTFIFVCYFPKETRLIKRSVVGLDKLSALLSKSTMFHLRCESLQRLM